MDFKKAEFIKSLKSNGSIASKLSHLELTKLFDEIIIEMANCLVKIGEVRMKKLGTLSSFQKKETYIYDFQGNKVFVPVRKAVRFKPTKAFKDFLNGVENSEINFQQKREE